MQNASVTHHDKLEGALIKKDFEAVAAHAQNTSNILVCGLHPLMEDTGEDQDTFHWSNAAAWQGIS